MTKKALFYFFSFCFITGSNTFKQVKSLYLMFHMVLELQSFFFFFERKQKFHCDSKRELQDKRGQGIPNREVLEIQMTNSKENACVLHSSCKNFFQLCFFTVLILLWVIGGYKRTAEISTASC